VETSDSGIVTVSRFVKLASFSVTLIPSDSMADPTLMRRAVSAFSAVAFSTQELAGHATKRT
jgi:hypothetical protein